MTISLRPKGSQGRFYAPDRDIIEWFDGAVRASLTIAAEQLRDKPEKMEELGYLAERIAETQSQLHYCPRSDVITILRKLYDDTAEHSEVWQLLAGVFMHMALSRYMAGIRESTDSVPMSPDTLRDALVSMFTLIALPTDLGKQTEQTLRLSGQLNPAMFTTDPNYELVSEVHKQSGVQKTEEADR